MTRPGTQNSKRFVDDDPNKFIGRIVNGTYRIDEVIDVGGMGLVFRATRLNFNRSVAIKILRPSLSKDNDIIKRFQREIDVMTQLQHPNIISILDVGRDASGFQYFVMEYIPGETLDVLLKKNALHLSEILEVFRQLCSAISEAHLKHIIHRDIKFENILGRRLHDGNWHIIVLDFGVAKTLNEVKQGLTRSGELPGTPGIIAPELVENPIPTPASDLYSIGVLLFTALTGKVPYEGENDFQIVYAHQNEPIPDIRNLVDNDVPEQIVELIYELMQKNPVKRLQSANEVQRRIEAIVRNSPSLNSPRNQNYIPSESFEKSEIFAPDKKEVQESPITNVAPASVVGVLIAIMIVLVLIVCYLLYRQLQ